MPRVAAAAVGEDDRADHRDQQDQARDFEREQVAAVEQLPERDDVRAGVAAGIVRPLSAGPACRAMSATMISASKHQRDDDPERQVRGEA